MKRFVYLSIVALGAISLNPQGFANDVSKAQPAACVPQKMLQYVRNLPQVPFIRVLLAAQKSTFQVEVQGSHNIYDPFTGKKLEAAFMSSSYQMTPTADGIKWGQEFPGIYQILIVPDVKNGTVVVDGIQYSGAVAFYEVGSTLAAVNWVSLEDMTSSLLSMIMAPTTGDQKEALGALAIGVRTLANEQILHSTHQFWDVRADSCGYKGLAVVRQDEPFQEAIKGSKNLVLEPRSEASAGLSAQELEKLKQTIIYQQAIDLAQNGKDASYILMKFFPGRSLENVLKQ